MKYFQEKKIDLKENLIADLEEKKRSIELERSSLELSGGSTHFILSTSLGTSHSLFEYIYYFEDFSKLQKKQIFFLFNIDVL